MFSPAITLIIFAVIAIISFGGGWAVNGWRLGGKIEHVESDNSILQAANERCATDVFTVKKAVTVLTRAAEERQKIAAASMNEAQPEAATHTAKAKTIMAQAPVPVDRQCEAIASEQVAYVKARH